MTAADPPHSPEAFLAGSGLGIAVFRRIQELVPDAVVRVTRSQIAFRHRLELASLDEVDEAVAAWLREAAESASQP